MTHTTSTAVAELTKQTSAPFESARSMPPSVYTSEEFLQHELDNIFSREWVCVGRSSSIPNEGDYITYELAGQPVFVIRQANAALSAMSNVCLHRMSTLLEGSGTKKSIVCPYHAWTYNTDGSLRAAPAMTQNEGFCVDNYKLPQLGCEEWLGWIMVSLDPEATSASSRLAEVEKLVGDYEMEHYIESFHETHIWDTNWKILAENFMESYHLPVCHAGTIGGLSKLDEMICPEGRPAFNYHTILKNDELGIALAHESNTRMQGERRRTTFLLSVYPSLLITLTPGYFWYLSLHPHGVGQVHITFGGGLSAEYANSPESQESFTLLKKLLDDVNVEDRGCTEKVYKGICAGAAKPGHLSHLERPNYDFAHYLAARVSC